MKIKWTVLGLALLAATASADMDMDMGHMKMDSSPAASPFARDMDVSMKQMDKSMSGAPMTGNADHDFAAMMIPHHQGAIDMAEAELKYGKDPAMRALATRIIADQKKEIAQMKSWMAKTAGK